MSQASVSLGPVMEHHRNNTSVPSISMGHHCKAKILRGPDRPTVLHSTWSKHPMIKTITRVIEVLKDFSFKETHDNIRNALVLCFQEITDNCFN